MFLFNIALELTVLLGVWLCLGAMQKDRSTPGRATFIGLCLAGIAWCMGELLFQRELVPEVVADRIKYIGVLTLPPLWAGLAAHAAGLEISRRVPWFPLALSAPAACLYPLMFNTRWSDLYLTTLPNGPDHYGPLWWAMVCYSYALVVWGSAVMMISAVRAEAASVRGDRAAVALAALAPMAGSVAFIASGNTLAFDPTPPLFAIALLALRGALFDGDLLEALPVTQHELIQQLPVAVVLTDRRGTVVDMNPAARQRLGIHALDVQGHTLDAVLARSDADIEVQVTPVRAGDREAGQLVLIDPPLAKA